MNNLLFYTLTVLIWGSTWMAIKFQLGIIDPMVSVSYRFSLAAILLLAWCKIFKLKMKFSLQEHFRIALQGVFLFGLNYLLFYVSELYLTSGLAAVIYSTTLIMNIVNSAIFLKSPLDLKVIVGGMFGLIGIVMVFKPELTVFSFNDKEFYGVMLCFAATFLTSIGNIISAYNQKKALPILQTNAYGMAYGAILMLSLVFFSGKEFGFVFTTAYVSSLFYLAIFGSIIVFGCYLTLIGNIGADRAAYATLLIPIVALGLSTLWEGYQWTFSAAFGVMFILTGNLIILIKRKERKKGIMDTEGIKSIFTKIHNLGGLMGFLSGKLQGAVYRASLINFSPSINITKEQFKANLVSYYFFINIIGFILIYLKGFLSFSVVNYIIVLIPITFIGAWLGTYLSSFVNEYYFKKIVLFILVIVGVKLSLSVSNIKNINSNVPSQYNQILAKGSTLLTYSHNVEKLLYYYFYNHKNRPILDLRMEVKNLSHSISNLVTLFQIYEKPLYGKIDKNKVDKMLKALDKKFKSVNFYDRDKLYQFNYYIELLNTYDQLESKYYAFIQEFNLKKANS